MFASLPEKHDFFQHIAEALSGKSHNNGKLLF